MIPELPPLAETAYGFKKRLSFVAAVLEDYSKRTASRPRVLEVGCGTGNLLAAPLARMDFEVLGIDVDRPSIAYAREHHAAVAGLHFECVGIEQCEEASFDVVICSEVLEHVREPELFLRQIRRCMRSAGVLILTVPNGYGPFEAQSWFWRTFIESTQPYQFLRELRARSKRNFSQAAFLTKDSPHVNFFTRREVKRLAAGVGMEVATYRGRTFVCGMVFAPLFLFPGATRFNAWLGDSLPSWAVSGWMFVLRNRPQPC